MNEVSASLILLGMGGLVAVFAEIVARWREL